MHGKAYLFPFNDLKLFFHTTALKHLPPEAFKVLTDNPETTSLSPATVNIPSRAATKVIFSLHYNPIHCLSFSLYCQDVI